MDKKTKESLRKAGIPSASKEVFRIIEDENLVFPIAKKLRMHSSEATAFLRELEKAFLQFLDEE